MKVSAWLVIEIRKGNRNWKDERRIKIAKVLQSRPENEMAVRVTLDIDPEALQPHVEAAVKSGMIVFDVIEETEERNEV